MADRSRQPSRPRRRPGQARSRETAEAILEATARILVEEGIEAASTKRIAARAGVGIGSVYEYFEDRDALVAALVRRFYDQHVDLARAHFASAAPDRPIAEVLGPYLDENIALGLRNAALTQVLLAQVPDRFGADLDDEVDARIAAIVAPYLRARGEADPEASAFVLVRVGRATLQAALRTGEVEMARVRTVLTRLITGFVP